MPLKKQLEIFRPGTFVAENGQTYTFSEADVKASVAAYKADVFKAPLVVGHPKTDDPAYGWVAGLNFSEDSKKVLADPDQVDAEFAELVNDGRYPKISASFYPPEHPSNPVPGVYYLRHVGFLGAQAPAVKGLKTASFADEQGDVITIDFSEGEQESRWALARLARNLRDWMIEKFDLETADRVVPDWVAASAEDAERAGRKLHTSFSEPEDKTVATPEDKNKTADFAERENQLKTREQELAAREKQIADADAKRKREEVASFVEGLVKEGKVLPAEKTQVVSLLASLPDDKTISFAEGEATVEKNPADVLRGLLEKLPARVDFSERGAPENSDSGVANFAAPAGYAVDSSQNELHAKINAYAKQHNVTYAQAAQAVGS
jgi:hypothetical protein